MKKPLVLAIVLAILLASPGAPAAAESRPYRLDLTVATYGGAFDGEGVREESGSLAILEAIARPEVRGDRWRLEAPFRVSHRQTFGADLSETTGSLDLEPWYEATKRVRVGLEAGVRGASRPGWPDPYQPVAGGLAATDRYGWFGWRAGVQAYARPAPHHHVRARYRYASYDFVDDPAFNPNVVEGGNPMHLTPRDNVQHQVDLSWRYVADAWALAVRLDYARRQEGELLARSAGTGSTRATPASPLFTTPRQEVAVWEPSAELQASPFGDRLELSFRYGVDLQDDVYQGYYSYTQHHPRVAARLAVTERLSATATYEAWLRTYGANGTAAARLEYGTRRTSSRVALGGELGYDLGRGLRARGAVEWVDRGTNFADYVPPASVYDIDWDYTNVTVLAGVEYNL